MSTPININVRSLDWKTEMTSKIMKYHVIGCWLAVIINTLWIIADYYTVPVNWKLFAGIDLAASLTIALAVLLRKHLKIKPKILGLIPMITISLSTAFVYNQIDLESFQKTSFAYATVFIGGGMILLWDVTYSIIVVAISVVANIFLFSKLSPLSIEEFLLNGGILVFSVSIFMIISVQIRYLLVKKDISSTLALKRSQDQLRKLSQAVVQSPVSIMISTLEGEIDYVNPTFEKVTGYTSSEIIGKRGGVLNSTNKNPEEYQSIWNTLSSGNVWKGEFQSKKKNGETIIEDISVTPIKNEMNEVTHYLEIKEDVTAKKQILNKLQESEKKHRVLFDYNPIPMVVFSIQKKAIIEVNQTIIGKYGYSRDEFLNIEQVNTDLYDSIYEISQQKDGDSKDSESAHVLKNGEFVIVEASVTDVDFLGEKVKLISINDISELKYIQMALQDAKQIAEKSRDLQSQFLSNMSHEIRTPMNGILGITRILQKTNVTSEQKHYLKSIYSSANNLMVIINDILDFTKIEAGKLTIEEVPFSLREQIENWYDQIGRAHV